MPIVDRMDRYHLGRGIEGQRHHDHLDPDRRRKPRARARPPARQRRRVAQPVPAGRPSATSTAATFPASAQPCQASKMRSSRTVRYQVSSSPVRTMAITATVAAWLQSRTSAAADHRRPAAPPQQRRQRPTQKATTGQVQHDQRRDLLPRAEQHGMSHRGVGSHDQHHAHRTHRRADPPRHRHRHEQHQPTPRSSVASPMRDRITAAQTSGSVMLAPAVRTSTRKASARIDSPAPRPRRPAATAAAAPPRGLRACARSRFEHRQPRAADRRDVVGRAQHDREPVEQRGIGLQEFQDHGRDPGRMRKVMTPPAGCPSAEMIRHSAR